MEKYEVIGLLGEGSFGRVFKAKQICDSAVVALKVISKRGKSMKEIKGLRRECDIQRHLLHPNIIKMLDSFETDNDIVVITEFAHKQLNLILSKEGYLPEQQVQAIVWDLVSALYYLHSHRVLHRDLKPQNILLNSRNRAKLCDFGFARNMSTGTHVLTSIKGTPLYMAPELIEEHPYDHSADLWSLGCIIYELLVGAPPFCTTSILHLIRMIRHEQIQWPMLISDACISFLKGLLQKDPTKRLSWPEILKHPFVKGHVLILEEVSAKPLTRPLSYDTLQAKEQQMKDCLTQKTQTKLPSSKSTEICHNQDVETAKCSSAKASKPSTSSNPELEECDKKSFDNEQDHNLNCKDASLSVDKNAATTHRPSCEFHNSSVENKTDDNTLNSNESKESHSNSTPVDASMGSSKDLKKVQESLNLCEDSTPIENEEWIVFLQRTIEEVMGCEMASLSQPSLANIVISPLRNSNTSPKVVAYIAMLLSLPFVVPGTPDSVLQQIKKVYVDVKVIPNLVYASKLLMKHKRSTSSNTLTASPSPISSPLIQDCGSTSELTDEELYALERLYLLICHLVHLEVRFLSQFCDSVVIFSMYSNLHSFLLLSKTKLRIVTDLLAILTHVLRKLPENAELVDKVVLNSHMETELEEVEALNLIQLLRHCNSLLRERSCNFLQFLGSHCQKTLDAVWSDCMRETLEALAYDSMENVRNIAETTVDKLKKLPFYYNLDCSIDRLHIKD